MSGKRKWGWADQWDAQRGHCWICLEPMLLNAGLHPLAASIEHIVPRSRGGGESWRNKLLAHRACNSARGAPFIWIKLNVFRRAAMIRLHEGLVRRTTVEGVDLGSSYRFRSTETIRTATRRPATVPSEIAGKALRVTLGELAKI